jgi:hypothetical protein
LLLRRRWDGARIEPEIVVTTETLRMSRKTLDDLMEAVAFAEAGETETARKIASELFPDARAREGERILSVSGASGFSDKMIEQAVAMAERLAFGLVALSVPPAMARLANVLRGGGREARRRRSVDAFRALAAERRVPFAQAVRGGDPEKAVAEVRRRFRRIAFLLIEPEVAPRARFATLNIPVFYLDER